MPVAQALPRVAASWVSRGPGFSRVVGTSRGFTPQAADLRRWFVFSEGAVADWPCTEAAALTLEPLSSRGSWGGWSPQVSGRAWDGPVVAVTRARLRLRRELTFRRAVPAVASSFASAGALWSAGFGELPVGFQGTVSVWPSAAALADFAWHGAHRDVVERTPVESWYAEELFTRCALVDADGVLDGRPAADLLG